MNCLLWFSIFSFTLEHLFLLACSPGCLQLIFKVLAESTLQGYFPQLIDLSWVPCYMFTLIFITVYWNFLLNSYLTWLTAFSKSKDRVSVVLGCLLSCWYTVSLKQLFNESVNYCWGVNKNLSDQEMRQRGGRGQKPGRWKGDTF